MTDPVLRDAQRLFRRQVHASWVFAALQERKLAGLIKDAEVGFAPRGRALFDFLGEQGHSPDAIAAAGLASQTEGALRPLLRDRLTIPVHSSPGDLVGFMGRASKTDAGTPKYLNTYAKRETVYGLWEGRAAGRAALLEGAWPVVVEGVFDVWAVRLAAGKAGLPLVPLAVCGSTLTRGHVEAIAAVTKRPLTFMFDGDRAGSDALLRAWQIAADVIPGVGHRALVLPGGTDPADLWCNAPRLLRSVLERPQSAAQRVAELRVAHTRHARESVNTKVSIARRLGADLGRVPAAEVAAYVRHVARLLQQDLMTTNACLLEGMGHAEMGRGR